MSRMQLPTQLAPAPFKNPTAFRITESSDYVKYSQQVFEGRTARGDDYWTAENITQTWYQAETGKIPIPGAGYGGKFAGEAFDGIWLDMSEIVRPTRDGIHGRETISTSVDLGRMLPALAFDSGGNLVSYLPPLASLTLPVLFNPLPFPLPGRGAVRVLALAAERAEALACAGVGVLRMYANEIGQDATGRPLPFGKDRRLPITNRFRNFREGFLGATIENVLNISHGLSIINMNGKSARWSTP
jgi:hypothetical protein